MSTLLALDTATEACSVALLHDGKVISHYEVIPRLHAQRLLPMIEALRAEAGISLSAIDVIAFGRVWVRSPVCGLPASVRVQGLAFALQRPVLPVSNLAVLAQRAYREFGAVQVAAAIDARMDEVYWGCYQLELGEMCLQGQESVLAPENACLPRVAAGEWFGAGTGWGTFQSRLPAQVAKCAGDLLPDALDLLQLAQFSWQRGEALAAEQAQPVYLRDNVATAKKLPV